jgi:hypothetical protein
MSATGITIIPDGYDAAVEAESRREKWWKRLVARYSGRCAARDCPYRSKLWPAWLRKPESILFEGHWYCEPGCLESAVEFRVRNLLSAFVVPRTRNHRIPIGLLLLDRGAISLEQLREALRLQREAGGAGRLGDWLNQMGAVREPHLAAALAQQWGCPVYPLDHQTAHPSWSGLVPLALLDSSRAVPAHVSSDGRVLHLAFGERLDHTLLYAIEQMLDCRTVACVAPQAKVAEFLRYWRRRAERPEISFDTIRDPYEMTRIICNYAAELQSSRLAVARASAHIWARFYRRDIARDLLFRILPDTAPSLPFEKAPGKPKAFLPAADSRKDGVSDAAEPL